MSPVTSTTPTSSSPSRPPFDRKSHAVGVLAEKILFRLPDAVDDGQSWEVCVEHVITQLECAKGAAYEVFHVLEALMMVTKVRKNIFSRLSFSHPSISGFRSDGAPIAGTGERASESDN